MEVILVDDGSPDDCPHQCDDWAQRDARIRTIHKANGGLSDARNAGLEIATGDYLTFVDADDYLAPNTYQQLMKQLSESPETDLLEYPAYIRYGASDQHRLTFRRQTFNDATQYWYATQAYEHCYACNKALPRQSLRRYTFPRRPGVRRHFHTTPTAQESPTYQHHEHRTLLLSAQP